MTRALQGGICSGVNPAAAQTIEPHDGGPCYGYDTPRRSMGSDGNAVLGTGMDYSTLSVHTSSGIEPTADVSKCYSLRRARSAWRSIPLGSFSYGPTSCSLMADVQPSTGGLPGQGALRGNGGMTTFFTGVRPCAHRFSFGTACSSHFPMGWSYLYGHSAEASRASVDFPGWGDRMGGPA